MTKFHKGKICANDSTSLPPNPDIANVMFIGGLIEHWGRGLSMMNSKCKNAGLPKPKINDNSYMVKVIFTRPSTKDKRTVGEQLENSRRTVNQHFIGLKKAYISHRRNLADRSGVER